MSAEFVYAFFRFAIMSQSEIMPGGSRAIEARVRPVQFDVASLPIQQQLLAWRERVGQIIDVVPSRTQIELPFSGYFDRYAVEDLVFNDCYSDQVTLDRSITRISRDSARGIAFQVFLEGDSRSAVSYSGNRYDVPLEVGILAADLDQPFRVVRHACRHINLFAPASRVQRIFPDPALLHGRILSPLLPSVRLIMNRVERLRAGIRMLTPREAHRELGELLTLILAAYGKDLGLAGSQSALNRAAMLDGVRRFIHANLCERDLTAQYVVDSLGVSRPTIYRLFQHEGGLGNYIQDLRLRTAARELVNFPSMPIKDVAYSLGFGSPSAFTRAFRKAFDIAPHDIRVTGQQRGDTLRISV
jgi:AraC-like DNA-binding protein